MPIWASNDSWLILIICNVKPAPLILIKVIWNLNWKSNLNLKYSQESHKHSLIGKNNESDTFFKTNPNSGYTAKKHRLENDFPCDKHNTKNTAYMLIIKYI